MILVIAEKPSVAADLAKVLGAASRKDGYYEGNGYQVSWCIGHLVQLAPPESYGEQFKKWSMETLPILPERFKTQATEQTKKQFNIVQHLINENNEIICATDAGREGQLIFEYVFRLSKNYKSKKVKRLWISSMTEESIKQGFATLKDNSEYQSLYESARCRSEADWLIGMNCTRLFTTKYGTKLTVGRVQTPTLGMIVNRHKAIKGFKSEPYFQLEGMFDGATGIWSKGEINRLKTENEAVELKNRLEGQIGIVTKFETKQKTEERPLLFDLTELQREANRRFGYTAQETLTIAQSLYETHKLTTYPRTDSRYLTEDMQSSLPNLLQSLHSVYSQATSFIAHIQRVGLNIDKRIIDNSKVSDHHAIIPTEKISSYNPDRLNQKENNVLLLIMTRFIVALAEPKQYLETKLEISISEDRFSATGKKSVNEGWQLIEKGLLGKTVDEDSQEEPEQVIGNLALNQSVKLNQVNILQKKTTPPKAYTEATLLTAMEKVSREIEDAALKETMKDHGLGTPATRASIIEKLISVGYIERKRKTLQPTEQGIKFIELIPDKLKSPLLTAEWEQKLEDIYHYTERPEAFIEGIKAFVSQVVTEQKSVEINQQPFNGQSMKEVIGKCPKCGKNVYESAKSFYCEGFKDTPKCTFSLWKEDKYFGARGKKITKTIAKKLLKDGKVEMKGLKSQSGKEYNAIFIMEVGQYANFKMEFFK